MKYGGQYNFTWHRPGKTPAGTLLLASILLLAGTLLPAGILLPASTLLLPPPHRLAPYCYHTNLSTAASFLLPGPKTHKTRLANSGRYNLVSWPH